MKRIGILCLVVFVTTLCAWNVIAAPVVELSPVDLSLLNNDGQIEVLVGSTFDVEINFTGLDGNVSLDNGNGLVGMNLGISWDGLVDFISFSNGSAWDTIDQDSSTEGELVLNGYQYGTSIDYDHLIGTLSFTCKGEGLAELTPYELVPDFSFGLEDRSQLVGVQFEGITVNQVQAIPIPPAILLLGGGLLGMLGIRRKIKQ